MGMRLQFLCNFISSTQFGKELPLTEILCTSWAITSPALSLARSFLSPRSFVLPVQLHLQHSVWQGASSHQDSFQILTLALGLAGCFLSPRFFGHSLGLWFSFIVMVILGHLPLPHRKYSSVLGSHTLRSILLLPLTSLADDARVDGAF